MLIGLVLGLAVGLLWPAFGASLRPVGTAFVEAVKMIVIPVVFSSVTLGIYRMGTELRLLGRIVAICLGYFYLATLVSIISAFFSMPRSIPGPALRSQRQARFLRTWRCRSIGSSSSWT